jgi:phosphoglycerate dehydrogenase-like enzyme
MGFKLVILQPAALGDTTSIEDWPAKLKQAIPDIQVTVCNSAGEAMESIEDADAAFGDIAPELFARAGNLKWIACPQAGPRAGYYHQALIESDVVVTNTREIYNDHIASYIMSLVLAFAKGLHVYIPQQHRREWRPGYAPNYLPDSTAIVVGVGGIGAETARLCAEFGMTVLGIDPRRSDAPPGVAELHRPDSLGDVLPRGDFVIVTVPETPETQGMFAAAQFASMKPSAFFINIGRGATVVLDDLVVALEGGRIAGAGLDVFQVEPLPADHPLWAAPGVLITPHVAGIGPYLDERRIELFIDNCVRFNEGMTLRNVVDKARWF